MATSSARKRSVPVRATVTSCCNRTRAPPNAAKSAKVKRKKLNFDCFFSFFVASHHRLSPLKCQMSLVVDRTGPRLYVPTLSARPPESSKRETDYAGLTGRNVQLILYTGTLPYHFDRQKTKGKLDSFLVFFLHKTNTHAPTHRATQNNRIYGKFWKENWRWLLLCCVCVCVQAFKSLFGFFGGFAKPRLLILFCVLNHQIIIKRKRKRERKTKQNRFPWLNNAVGCIPWLMTTFLSTNLLTFFRYFSFLVALSVSTMHSTNYTLSVPPSFFLFLFCSTSCRKHNQKRK